MAETPQNVAVLGATGSVGVSALEVIEASNGRLKAVALSAHSQFDSVVRQANRVKPRWVIATDARGGSLVRLGPASPRKPSCSWGARR